MAQLGVSPIHAEGVPLCSNFVGRVVQKQDHKAFRPWRIVAAEATNETDPQKMLELINELHEAVEERERAFRTLINPKPA